MNFQTFLLLSFCWFGLTMKSSAAGSDDVPLVPRKAFFGNPEKARPRLSPDDTL